MHRDLACRNVLVGTDKLLKISDLGLARQLNDSLVYCSSVGGKLPLRWMAPEAIKTRTFNVYTDMYAMIQCSYVGYIFFVISDGVMEWPCGNFAHLVCVANFYKNSYSLPGEYYQVLFHILYFQIVMYLMHYLMDKDLRSLLTVLKICKSYVQLYSYSEPSLIQHLNNSQYLYNLTILTI